MTNITGFIGTQGVPKMMGSIEIAELTGKENKHVIRDIRVMLASLKKDGAELDHQLNQGFREEKDERGYTSCIYMSKELTYTLVMGYSPALRLAVVQRWQELEAEAAAKAAPNFNIPTTLSGALMLAAKQAEQIEQQAAQLQQQSVELIEQDMQLTQQGARIDKQASAIRHQSAQLTQQRPAVQFVEEYSAADGLQTIRQVAKLLHAKQNDFVAFLIDHRVLYRLNGDLAACAPQLSAGRLSTKTHLANGRAINQPLFTAKGVLWIAGLWQAAHPTAQPELWQTGQHSGHAAGHA